MGVNLQGFLSSWPAGGGGGGGKGTDESTPRTEFQSSSRDLIMWTKCLVYKGTTPESKGDLNREPSQWKKDLIHGTSEPLIHNWELQSLIVISSTILTQSVWFWIIISTIGYIVLWNICSMFRNICSMIVKTSHNLSVILLKGFKFKTAHTSSSRWEQKYRAKWLTDARYFSVSKPRLVTVNYNRDFSLRELAHVRWDKKVNMQPYTAGYYVNIHWIFRHRCWSSITRWIRDSRKIECPWDSSNDVLYLVKSFVSFWGMERFQYLWYDILLFPFSSK